MSLFGGDGPTLPLEPASPLQISQDLQVATAPDSPQHAQQREELDDYLDQDYLDNRPSESESEADASIISDNTRPNRFHGKSQTWKEYTAADRQIAESLDRLQDQDLAAHLFNAHALKRSARKPVQELSQLTHWDGRDEWIKRGKDLEFTQPTGLVEMRLVPSKDWTAWPLPPTILPGQGTTQDHASLYTHNIPDVGDEMREELQAVFLRLAKDRFYAREAEEEGPRSREQTAVSRSRSRSRSKSIMSMRSYRSKKSHRSNSAGSETEHDDLDLVQQQMRRLEEGIANSRVRKRGRKAQEEIHAQPTVMTDENRARRLLQPTIQELLSKIDNLALAIHRTRSNQMARGGASDMSSLSDFTSGAESDNSHSRPNSRATSRKTTSRKSSTRPSSAKNVLGASGHSINREDKGHPDTDDNLSDGDEHAKRRNRSDSEASMTSSVRIRDETRRIGLIDWSEVLGLAAVQGWNQQALARTAQRCADLFGEEMAFLPVDADRPPKHILEPVLFATSVGPAPSRHISMYEPSRKKRPIFQTGTLRCPHEDCYGHLKDFALAYRVVEHCIRQHGYDPRTNNSENEERTLGGVHVDGFLQPVTAKPGWLGRGRSKAGRDRKRQKMGEETSANASEEETLVKSPGHDEQSFL